MKRLLLAFGLTAALVGCTQQAASPGTEPAASTPPAPTESPAQPAPVTDAAPASTAAVSAPAQPIPSRWKAGTNYQLVVPAQGTSADPGQVEVLEFLWLGCPHCYELNPYVEAWKKHLPPYVKFTQVHITFDAGKVAHARLFYTIQALGGDDLVAKAFDEIHRRKNTMVANDEAATLKAQQAFAVANGIDAAAFKREYNGFAVNASVQRANQLSRAYRIDGVPTFVVNGKYITGVGEAGGSEELMQLLTDLAASEKTR